MRSHHSIQSIDGHRSFTTTTPLNARLDRAFQRCLDRGGHTPSGENIVRDFGNHQRNLPICRSCRCPYGFPVIRSARNRWNGTNG